MSTNEAIRLVIISGRSGSGKSTVLNTLEDSGFTCIDNLPPPMIPQLVHWMANSATHKNLAVCVDVRISTDGLHDLPGILNEVESEVTPEILFLDANETVLLQRFSATRRKHPLTNQQRSLAEAIAKEQEFLGPIANRANVKLDTTALSVQELRQEVRNRIIQKTSELTLQFLSFGFKHGLPRDADLVFDVRCLPNPYWDKSLRMFTGQDEPVKSFLKKETDVIEMFEDIRRYVRRWLPKHEENQRSYLTVAIGCTGGQHRSVYLSEQLAQTFKSIHPNTQIRHRDLGLKTQ